MDISPAQWMPDSPFRSPAWRVLRATYRLLYRRRVDRRIDDEWAVCAYQSLRETGKVRNPAISAALALWSDSNPVRRWHLEARLLTQESWIEVARNCVVEVPVVEAYHQLFFDVQSRLKAKDWIMHRAVQCTPPNNFAGQKPGGLWRYAAFTGGPRILDVVVAVTMSTPLPGWLRSTFSTAREEEYFRQKWSLGLSVLTAQSDREAGKIATRLLRLWKLEGRHSKRGTLSPFLGSMARLLGSAEKGQGRMADPDSTERAENTSTLSVNEARVNYLPDEGAISPSRPVQNPSSPRGPSSPSTPRAIPHVA